MKYENINIRKILSVAMAVNGIIVDVRCRERFLSGHIPMSVNVPYSLIEDNLVTLPKNRTLILYCETGGTSAKAASKLSDMGYRVINCVGGIRNYNGSLTK